MSKKKLSNRLPPRVGEVKQRLQQKARGKTSNGLKAGTPIFLALLACGVFIVLIATGMGVRLLILRRGADAKMEPAAVQSKFADAPKTQLPDAVLNNNAAQSVAPELSELTTQKLPSPVDASQYEVLPPPAAKRKNRKIPGLLYVGDEEGMFEELHTALEAMVPGDMVEIRTNRILTVEPCLIGKEIASEIEPVDLPPIMIRAAEGYSPLLRVAQQGPVIRVHHRSIWLKNLHFAARDTNTSWFQGEGLTVMAQSCSVTGGALVSAMGNSTGRRTNIYFDLCLVRNSTMVWSSTGAVGDVGIYRTAMAGCGAVNFGPGQHVLDIQRSTFLTTYILGVTPIENDVSPKIQYSMDRSIFQQFACCPNLIQLGVLSSDFPTTVDRVPATFERFVPNFSVTNSILSFHAPDGGPESHEGWGHLDFGSKTWSLRSSVFPMIDRQLLKLGLSPRATAAQEGCWNGLGGKDPAFPATFDLDRPDFIFNTDDAAVQQQLDARNVGCIPEWLPPVPIQAMELYSARPEPIPQ
jgi:hypothetical protein